MTQLTLPVDSHVLDPAECRRLSEQSQRILARLTQGPAANYELAALALKYTSRLSDLRKAGYTITPGPKRGGVVIYTLGN